MRVAAVLGILWTLVASGAYAQTSSLNTPATGQSTAVAASSLTVSGPHTLFGFHMTTQQAGYALIFDANSAPADGTVSPVGCFAVGPPSAAGQGSTTAMANAPLQVQMTTGLTIVFSTGATCFTKAAAPAFIAVIYQ